jgi:hypothetical protein
MKEEKNKIVGQSLRQMITKLVNLSKSDKYDVFNDIKWPESLSDNQFWISENLLSIYNTSLFDQIELPVLYKISKEECINFFSMNVHEIRNLLLEVIKYIHTPGFEMVSEYLHHFIDEENEHMYFFSKFCQKYGGKIYKDKRVPFPIYDSDDDVHLFLVFMRIWVFEEIIDHYNSKMSNDTSLHPFLREINMLHHKDESRHIAFGNSLLQTIFKDLLEIKSPEAIEAIRNYTKSYIRNCIEMFYNPYVYKEAGLTDFYTIRSKLVEDQGRKQIHAIILNRVLNKLSDCNILLDKNIYA